MPDKLPDMQNSKSDIKLPIERVGINGLTVPIFISIKDGGYQHTVANVDIYVDLDSDSKGTHMSRLAVGLQKFLDQKLDSNLLREISEYIRQKCEAQKAEVIYSFPYFIKKIAPVSKEPGVIHYNITFDMVTGADDYSDFRILIEVVGTSLCPCSKEISNSGAHNQRSKILINCVPNDFVWIEDIIETAESSFSCQVYSVLKRTDEKYVTEEAYDNPAFVEDIVRKCYNDLWNNFSFKSLVVEVRNEESIHLHDAYARISSSSG